MSDLVPADAMATPIDKLPPPVMQSKNDFPRLDTDNVLNYNDILQELEHEKNRPAVHQPQQQPMQQYPQQQQPMLVAPAQQQQQQQPQYPYYGAHPQVLHPQMMHAPESWMSRYKYVLFVGALVFATLYVVRPRLAAYFPQFYTEGRLNTMGIVFLSALAGVGFEIGNNLVVSKM